ncbi:lanthionine synthetase C family protein [Streptomyces natalensis]|uniref:lanthionine synthetase C family protein n=1 Tax=Streptomyces natalensis TaxID=68242 RepID=UPI00069056F8|nr:lanthionine synthetase C family protein [Streptomyces natalensis]
MTASAAAPADPGDRTTRERARRAVYELADAPEPGDGSRYPPGRALSLADGHPGLALLFAELSHTAPPDRRERYRAAAHAHLAAAAAQVHTAPTDGLFQGPPALAFAAHAARHAPDDYARLLHRLDDFLARRVHTLLTDENARLDAGRPGTRIAAYDVVSGATGLGRLLLARHPSAPHGPEAGLRATVRYLIRLSGPVRAHGRTVPGWWTPDGPSIRPEPALPRGHLNFGLAHGIAGPLALLALTRRAGLTEPGHDAAVTTFAEALAHQRRADGQWAGVVPFDDYADGRDADGRYPDHPHPDDGPASPRPVAARTAWCYGTPGAACALHLAAEALGRPDWSRTAVADLTTALEAPRGVTDAGLCHGWAGLLHLTAHLARCSGDPHLTARAAELAGRLLDALALSPQPRSVAHRTGLLDGAAGIALALHSWAADAPPATAWDAALLIR